MSNTRKPSNPREAESKDSKKATVEWRGHKFAVDRNYDDWTVDFLESIEEGKAVGIVRGALGPQQWQIVKAMQLKVRDLNELAALIANSLGFGSTGESPASSD